MFVVLKPGSILIGGTAHVLRFNDYGSQLTWTLFFSFGKMDQLILASNRTILFHLQFPFWPPPPKKRQRARPCEKYPEITYMALFCYQGCS